MDLIVQDGDKSKPIKELKNARDEKLKFMNKEPEKSGTALETQVFINFKIS